MSGPAKLRSLKLDGRPRSTSSPKQPDKSKLQLKLNPHSENDKPRRTRVALKFDDKELPEGAASKSESNGSERPHNERLDSGRLDSERPVSGRPVSEQSPSKRSPSKRSPSQRSLSDKSSGDQSTSSSPVVLPEMPCDQSPIRGDQQVNSQCSHLVRSDQEFAGSLSTLLSHASITGSFIMRSTGWWNTFLGCCLVPLVDTIRHKVMRVRPTDEWVIPYSAIRDQEFITSGAEGSVFKAKLYGQTIAVKRVKNKDETEIKHLKQLKHHNIVRFIGVCTSPYCVLMEFCPNGTLSNLLKRRKNDIEPELIWDFAFQIASGMNYLHHNQIIHRDLKTDNILISNDNLIKITDFGVSKQIDPTDIKDMTFVGTFQYMPPEIIRKTEQHKCSEKIDCWAFGVVLWELMSCEKPYGNVDHHRTLFGVALCHFCLPISSLCPDEMRLIIEMCWSLQPANRPSFSQIMLHLQIFCKDILYQMSVEQLNAIKRKWAVEIEEKYAFYESVNLNKPGSCLLDDDSSVAGKQRQDLANVRSLLKMYEAKGSAARELCEETRKVLARLTQESSAQYGGAA